MKDTRKFGNKRYRWANSFMTKKVAKRYAAQIRTKGQKARVTKDCAGYEVWRF